MLAFLPSWIRWTRFGLFVVGVAAAGCLSTGDSPLTSSGELDNGQFTYHCVRPTDAACSMSTPPDAFLTSIAVGGRFVLRYDSDEDGQNATVVSAVRDRITHEFDVFTVLRPGFVAMLAKLPTGDVIDIKHTRGKTIESLAFYGRGPSPIRDVEIEVGSAAEVLAVPVDNLGQPLAGTLDFEWAADDDLVLIEGEPEDSAVTVYGVEPGSTRITVTTGDIEATLDVVVGEGSNDGDDTGTDTGDDTGTGTDTGDDTGTGTDTGDDTGTGTDTSGDTGTDTASVFAFTTEHRS